MGIPQSEEPRYAAYIDTLAIRLAQRALGVEVTLFQACSARNAGHMENAIYSGYFDEKCHFIWLNHANSGAHFLRKPLIFIGWRMSPLSPVDISFPPKSPGSTGAFLWLFFCSTWNMAKLIHSFIA